MILFLALAACGPTPPPTPEVGGAVLGVRDQYQVVNKYEVCVWSMVLHEGTSVFDWGKGTDPGEIETHDYYRRYSQDTLQIALGEEYEQPWGDEATSCAWTRGAGFTCTAWCDLATVTSELPVITVDHKGKVSSEGITCSVTGHECCCTD